MSEALKGVSVLELGTFITGPYAGMLLAELGADVIKIEKPGTGDPFRSYQGSLFSPQFRAYNVNKRSLTLDLKSVEGRAVFLNLASRADVLIENFRPGVLEGLNAAWPQLHTINPKLIYCSVNGFGSRGRYAERPCYDTVAQALSGYLSQFVDRSAPRIAGPAVADAISGMFAALGILGALSERARTGAGKKVEVAMLDALIAFATEPFSAFFATGSPPGPYTRPSISQSYVLKCSDQKLISLHLASPEKFWRSLTECIGRPDLALNPLYSQRTNRIKNFEQLTAELQLSFERHPREYWLEKLPRHDVPHAPVVTLDEVPALDEVRGRAVFKTMHHLTEGDITGIRSPIVYDDEYSDVRPPPTLGQHSEEILREFGYSQAEIDSLQANNTA